MKTIHYDYLYKKNKADYVLSLTATLQPVLSIFELLLLDGFHMGHERANMIRIILTALPIIVSMIFVIKRNLKITLVSYLIVIGLLLTGILIPGRWKYMSSDVLKFTIPLIVPMGLCIASVKNLPVLIRCMQQMSLIAALIGITYGLMYVSGAFVIDNYSISFSYSLLFPTFVLISRKGFVWKCIAALLMVEMLAIGSRGALLLSVGYWIFTIIWKNISLAKCIIWLTFFVAAYKLFFNGLISLVANIFDSIGINSRTLRLLLGNELIAHDSGRSELHVEAWKLINQAPFFGNGVWADRQYMGIYCHNIFIELLIDFGYIGTGIILSILAYCQLRIFFKIPKNHKSMYLMMLGIVCPLFVSSSYLVSYNVGMFLGFSYLLSDLHRKHLYQDYVFE